MSYRTKLLMNLALQVNNDTVSEETEDKSTKYSDDYDSNLKKDMSEFSMSDESIQTNVLQEKALNPSEAYNNLQNPQPSTSKQNLYTLANGLENENELSHKKRVFKRLSNKPSLGTYRKLNYGEQYDFDESLTSDLFGDCSSDEYQPNENDGDDSDDGYVISVGNRKKKSKNQKVGEESTGIEEDNIILVSQTNQLIVDEASNPVAVKRKSFPSKDKVTRKRQRNPDKWKKNKVKLFRERGQAYTNYKGESKPAKEVKYGNLCPENCRLQCSNVFSAEDRENILTSFYALDINAKNCLLFNSIIKSQTKRMRTGAVKHKTASYKYTVQCNSKQTTVCKRAFVSLYQISNKKVDLIQVKIKAGLAAPTPDRRGKHESRPNKTPTDVAAYVIQHISSFPSEESHYSRNCNIHKKYLSPLLSIPIMHKLYLEKCNGQDVNDRFKVKECTYRFYFNNEFNLSFGHPKSDTCGTCDKGDLNEEHIENYTAAFEAQRVDRELARTSNNTVYITIDLQQTMPLPRLSTSKAFYLRQMWFYNLGIHIVTKSVEKTVFCTWTEDIASRGSSEIFSCLLRAIEVEDSLKQKDNLIIWTDSCSGQNKNFLMLCLYQYFIQKGNFKVIDHKFPEVGHSYLDSDRAFGRIEKRLRKHQTISTPEQYREVIASSSKKTLVINMENHFRDTEDLPQKMKLVNRKKTC